MSTNDNNDSRNFIISTPVPCSLIIGSEYCNFITPSSKNLVLAFSDRIEVYEWRGNTLTKELRFLPGCNIAYIRCIKTKKEETDLIFIINSELEFSIFGYDNGQINFAMKGTIVSVYKRIREQGIQIAVCSKQGKVAITGIDQNLYVLDRIERTDRRNAEFIKGPLDVVDMAFVDYSSIRSETRIAMLVHYGSTLRYEVFELDYKSCSLRNILTVKDIPIHCTKLYCPPNYNDGTSIILGGICLYIVRGVDFIEKNLGVDSIQRIELDTVIDNGIISVTPFVDCPSKFAFCDKAGTFFTAEILDNDIPIVRVGTINPTSFLNHFESNIFFASSMIKDSILFSINSEAGNSEITNINILDAIPFHGPITDMNVINEHEQIFALCGGDGKNGFTSIIKHSPTFRCSWEFAAKGLHRCFVIPIDSTYNLIFASTVLKTVSFVLNKITGEKIEREFPGFEYKARTIYVDYYYSSKTFIQVTDIGVSITNLDDKIAPNCLTLDENEIICVSSNNNGIYIVSHNNIINMYDLRNESDFFIGEYAFNKNITSIDMLKAVEFKSLAYFVVVFDYSPNIYIFKATNEGLLKIINVAQSSIENVGIVNDVKWYWGNDEGDSIIVCDFSGNAYIIDFDPMFGFNTNYLIIKVGEGALETFECAVNGQRSIFFSCENSGFCSWKKWKTDISKLNINTSLHAYSYYDNKHSYIVYTENNVAKISYLTDEKEISYNRLEIDYDLTRFTYDKTNNVILAIANRECQEDVIAAKEHDFDYQKPEYGERLQFPFYELSKKNLKEELAQEIKETVLEESNIVLISLDHMKVEAMYKLQPSEIALCIQPITIPGNLGSFFVVGTAIEKYDQSQSEIVDGRLLLIEIKGKYNKMIEVRAEKNVKSAVFDICTKEDLVVATMLNSVRMFQCTVDDFKLKHSKYEFLRASKIELLDDKIIVGDVLRSVSVLNLTNESIDMSARLTDSRGLTSLAIIDKDCYLRCVENYINILTDCDTEEVHSLNIIKTFHIGMQVNKIVHGHVGNVDLSKFPSVSKPMTLATLEGALLTLFEVDGEIYKFLKIIEGKIYDCLPKFFESNEPSEIMIIKGKRQFINTDYFKYLMTLPFETRKQILNLEGLPPYPYNNEIIDNYETLDAIVSSWSQLF